MGTGTNRAYTLLNTSTILHVLVGDVMNWPQASLAALVKLASHATLLR